MVNVTSTNLTLMKITVIPDRYEPIPSGGEVDPDEVNTILYFNETNEENEQMVNTADACNWMELGHLICYLTAVGLLCVCFILGFFLLKASNGVTCGRKG